MARFVEAGICEALDEAESDCESADDPFANIGEKSRDLTCTALAHGTVVEVCFN